MASLAILPAFTTTWEIQKILRELKSERDTTEIKIVFSDSYYRFSFALKFR